MMNKYSFYTSCELYMYFSWFSPLTLSHYTEGAAEISLRHIHRYYHRPLLCQEAHSGQDFLQVLLIHLLFCHCLLDEHRSNVQQCCSTGLVEVATFMFTEPGGGFLKSFTKHQPSTCRTFRALQQWKH